MSRKIKISIRGRGDDTDAPTADDLLAQVRDYLDIIQGIEEEYAPDHSSAVVWRVTDAGKNTPLSLEVTPFSRQHAVNIDRRVDAIIGFAASGLNSLQETATRPRYFTDQILKKAEKVFERVTNGLDISEIDFGAGMPAHSLTPQTARSAQRNTRSVLAPDRDAQPYQELGSFEGYFDSVSRDGFGRPILHVRHRITGEAIKCILSESALQEIEDHKIGEVLSGNRIQVSGKIFFKSLGQITRAEIYHVAFLRSSADLPNARDIIDQDFTGGLSTEDYLDWMRNGEPS